MNASAAVCVGDVLLFLPADVTLPPASRALIARSLAHTDVAAAASKTWTVPDAGRWRPGPLLHLADLRSRYSSLPYGDPAVSVWRSVFERLGGYPDIPLMEDVELARRLPRAGRIARLSGRVSVSGRRFQERPVYYTAAVNVFPLLYRSGAPPATLRRLYGRPR